MRLEDLGYHLKYIPDGKKEVYLKEPFEIDFDEQHHDVRKYHYGRRSDPHGFAFKADEIKAVYDMMVEMEWIKDERES